MKNVAFVVEKFREKKWTLGKNIRAVLDTLAEKDRPISVLQIVREVTEKIGQKPERSTVYRILERLEQIGVVHRLQGGFIFCSNPQNTTQAHHFLVCDQTGIAEEVFMNYQTDVEKQLLQKKGFSLRNTEITFFGISRFAKFPKSMAQDTAISASDDSL